MDPVYAIEAHGLTKHFGDTRAVDGIDLQIEAGSVYGLLGPNGAGKTTTIRLLATLLAPTGGSAQVLGHDIATASKQVRQKISLTGQFASVDEELTGRENLILVGRLLGLKKKSARARADELLAAFDLSDAAGKLVNQYSGGMRRRLDIAASLVVTPEILFLDEPTTGLDPRSRNSVWDIVRAIAASGTTVLLTTQYLEEADRLADRLAVIDNGQIIAEGTSDELKARVGANALHLRVTTADERDVAMQILASILGEVAAGAGTRAITATVSDSALVPVALDALAANGVRVAEYSMGSPSLDEVFFALTGRPVETADEAAAEVAA